MKQSFASQKMSEEYMISVIENDFKPNQFAELNCAFGGNPAFFKTKL